MVSKQINSSDAVESFHSQSFSANVNKASTNSSSAPTDISKIGEKYTEQRLKNVLFPLRDGRRFQVNWIQKFPWIEYSIQRDAVFCYPCRQFSTASASRESDIKYTQMGYANWAKALEKQRRFLRHEQTEHHVAAVASMREKEV